ncbi:hypothetical protein OSTOST_10715 [Ostertagia ostertagi]
MDRLCADALRDYQRALFGLDRQEMPRYGFPLRSELIPPRNFFDPSALFPMLDQPKPQHSYIGLIAMAILSSPDKKKMVLSEVITGLCTRHAFAISKEAILDGGELKERFDDTWVCRCRMASPRTILPVHLQLFLFPYKT